MDISKTAVQAVRTEVVPSTVMQSTKREWLTEAEVERLIKAADCQRDGLMILIAYRHGLRVSELVSLQWGQIDLSAGRIAVRRLKGSEDGVHPLSGREIRSLRAVKRTQPVGSRFVFTTRLGGPFTRDGFSKMLAKAAASAGIDDVHPHLLRHGTGFKLVNQGIDSLSLAAYLGHRNINNTRRYTRMDAARFDGLWKD